jgi:hypothetical protein
VIGANAHRLIDAMNTCMPESYVREPGFGVRRIDWSIDESELRFRNEQTFELGGLNFWIFFDRDSGPSMVILAEIDGRSVEILRLDDYEDNPHYHAPVGVWHKFDRDTLGAPLTWFIDQIANHLEELLEKSGYGSLIPTLDFGAISSRASSVYDAMYTRVPAGMARVPAKGLQYA